MHVLPTSTSVTTFVRDTACVLMTATCGGGRFLKCARHNTLVPLIPMESYDVEASILALICAEVGCDLFTSKNDGSGGRLFKFGSSSSASTYIRYANVPPPPPTPGSSLWQAHFSGAVYTKPAVDKTSIARCAGEGETCVCTGTVYYGPGDFYSLLTGPHGSAAVRNNILCTDQKFGDPVPGQYKQCFCVSSGGSTTIYIGSTNGAIYALNADGTLRWEVSTLGSVERAAAVDALGNVYVGSHDQSLHAFRNDGTPIWQLQTAGALNSVPAVDSKGTLYFTSSDDRCQNSSLYALYPDGTLAWKYQMCVHLYGASPRLGSDGTVYVGSSDGFLHAVRSNASHAHCASTTLIPCVYARIG
jgi:outer membrane protein assembly factor BamB